VWCICFWVCPALPTIHCCICIPKQYAFEWNLQRMSLHRIQERWPHIWRRVVLCMRLDCMICTCVQVCGVLAGWLVPPSAVLICDVTSPNALYICTITLRCALQFPAAILRCCVCLDPPGYHCAVSKGILAVRSCCGACVWAYSNIPASYQQAAQHAAPLSWKLC
jgi:hypothetical protein